VSIFTRYLSRLYLGRAIGAALAFTALVQILDLVESATDVLDRGLGLKGVGYYTLLRLPIIVVEAFPLGFLVGALIVFVGLARANEVVVMRASGISSFRIVGSMVPAALLLAGLHFLLADQVAPAAERTLTLWWSETAPAKKGDRSDPKWFNVNPYIVSVNRVHDQGHRLEGIRIYQRRPNDIVTRRIMAREAVYQAGKWLLQDVAELELVGERVVARQSESLVWEVNLEPIDILGVLTPTGRVPVWTARAILKGERVGSKAPAFYETLLQRSAAEPVSALLMVLLAAPAAFRLRRGGNAAGLLLGLAFGLAFLLAEGVSTAMGEAGLLPAAIAAWGPLLLFTSIGVAFLMEAKAS
jgi:lipopolysaccharide export system permease protein